jgi:hypothetical protein
MTSGAALDEPSVRKNNQDGDCREQGIWALKGGEDLLNSLPCGESSEKWILNSKKRQISTMATSTPKTKKIRTSVQRTHSPKAAVPALPFPGLSRVEKAIPTVLGIEEVARHLIRTKSRNFGTRDPHSILALPTECTYEACSLLKWCKEETDADGQNAIRNEQLDRRK